MVNNPPVFPPADVVTEYGVAALHGCDLAERARRLISIAGPQFREELEYVAWELPLLS